MCGRYTLAQPLEAIRERVGDIAADVPLTPRYNIAPSQPVVSLLSSDPRRLVLTRWGLVPSWAKDPAIGNRLINARAETVDQKPAFRASFKSKRCLIFADGFYEWKTAPDGRTKTPMYVTLASGGVFAFAGLWSRWEPPDGAAWITSVILTTRPNALLADIHDRMPVILPPEGYAPWLDPAAFDRNRLKQLLRPFPAEELRLRPVSRAVNNVRHDAPDCIAPDPPSAQGQLF